MPKRKRTYVKSKRSFKRRRRNRTKTVSTLFGGTPFPKSWITKHRYVETFTLDPGISTPDAAYYSCNNLFDPTTAAGGHQPLGFDQMTPLYDHYTVLGAKCTVRFFSSADDVGSGANMCFIYVNDDSTAVLSYDTVMEQQKGRVKALTSGDAKQSCTISHKWSAKKFFGVKDVRDNSQLKGTTTGGPADQAYFVIGAQGIAAASNPATIYCNVTIDYITMWTERKSIAQS